MEIRNDRLADDYYNSIAILESMTQRVSFWGLIKLKNIVKFKLNNKCKLKILKVLKKAITHFWNTTKSQQNLLKIIVSEKSKFYRTNTIEMIN